MKKSKDNSNSNTNLNTNSNANLNTNSNSNSNSNLITNFNTNLCDNERTESAMIEQLDKLHQYIAFKFRFMIFLCSVLLILSTFYFIFFNYKLYVNQNKIQKSVNIKYKCKNV
jgi:hypothetical protein